MKEEWWTCSDRRGFLTNKDKINSYSRKQADHSNHIQWAKKMSKWFANVERLVHISRTTDWNKMIYVPLERSAS